jgi:hypothetical protein
MSLRSDPSTLLHPTDPTSTRKTRLQLYHRLRRWVLVTDPRIVRRFWPSPSDASRPPRCPVCGTTQLHRESLQAVLQLPAGRRASQAFAAGGLEALTAEVPIEPGELWYLVCLACLQTGPRTRCARWLPERLRTLVDEALTRDSTPGTLPVAA